MRWIACLFLCGCGSAVIVPGHRGLMYDPSSGGLQHEVLAPGTYSTGMRGHIDDFDVTYTTRTESIALTTADGLAMGIAASVTFRPIISELYQLDTEIGQRYYEEIIGPEFRSAVRTVFAAHEYADTIHVEKIEDEIEANVRRRVQGRHIEIGAVTFEPARR